MSTHPSLSSNIYARSKLRLDPSLLSGKRQTVPELVKYYLVSCRVEGKSPKTIEKYTQTLGLLTAFLNQQELSTYTARMFMAHLQERKLKATTILTYYQVLRAFCYWQLREGLIDVNPLATIKAPRIPSEVVKPLTSEDIHRLLVVALRNVPSGNVRRSDFIPLRNYAMVLLFLDTGLRLSELTNIQLADIDADNDCILVMGKGSKERRVRMGATTTKAVHRYIFARTDDYPCLWVSEERVPLTRYGVRDTVKTLFHRAGITGVKMGPHTLRHTAAISYLRNGGDWFTLQIMLGHASPVMTRRYLSSLGADDMMRVHQKASPVDNLKLR
jgi:site-specific recombinase XerD